VPPGNLSACSIQFGIAVAPSLPHWLHRHRGPNDGSGTSSGHASTLTAVSRPQCWQVTKSPRTPWRRIVPSVIGPIGSSERGIGGHSTPAGDVPEWAWIDDSAHRNLFVEAPSVTLDQSIALRPASVMR
jgi:hypothetical protein